MSSQKKKSKSGSKKQNGSGAKTASGSKFPQKGYFKLDNFHSCTSCNIILHGKDIECHLNTHKAELKTASHGFIKDKTIHPVLVQLNIKAEEFKDFVDPILLDRSIVKYCSLMVGHLVLVTHSDGAQTVHTLVLGKLNNPLSAAFISTASLGSSKAGDILKVEPYCFPLIKAKQIKVALTSPLHKEEEIKDFVEFFKMLFSHHLFCEGMVIEVPGFGKVHVKEIVPLELKSNEVLWESFSQLSLETLQTLDVQLGLCSHPPIFLSEDVRTEQNHHFILTQKTEILLSCIISKPLIHSNVSGLLTQKDELRHMICTSLPEIPLGLLLCGPSKSGHYLCKSLAEEINYAFLEVDAFYGSYFQEQLDDIVNQALRRAPALVFMRNLHSLCPPPPPTGESCLEALAIVNSFRKIKNKSLPSKPVQLIATAVDGDSIDPLLYGFKKFDQTKVIKLAKPSLMERKEILEKLANYYNLLLSEDDILTLAEKCEGWDCENLEFLINGVFSPCSFSSEASHRKVLFKKVEEMSLSLVPEYKLNIPKVSWDEIGGMEEIKASLQRISSLICNYKQLSDLGIELPKTLLFFGPPGCSKTMLAKAIASQSGLPFFATTGNDLVSKYVGDTEKNIVRLFEDARKVAPSVIFFDEFETICTRTSHLAIDTESRIAYTLKNELSKSHGILFIAATNLPRKLNKYFLNLPGIQKVYVKLPSSSTRKDIIRIKLSQTEVADDILIDELVARTEGFSGAEVVAAVNDACLKTLIKNPQSPPKVCHGDLLEAIQNIIPVTTPESLAMYNNFYSSFFSL